MIRTSCVTLTVALLLSTARPSTGQLIPIRTVPVASGDQFLLLPSSTLGMGGVRYAVTDSLGDPWSNPAAGSILTTTVMSGSPTFYGIEHDQGGGRTFPVAMMIAGARWFGGFSLALQQIENRDNIFFANRLTLDILPGPFPRGETLSERFGRNLYAAGYVGVRLDERWSVGLGLSAAALNAMDGVDLLYAGADRIDQSGTVTDIRVGLWREDARDRVGLVLAHDRVSMEHDVTFTEWVWDETGTDATLTGRVEHNGDETRTWAAEASWDRALDAPGWRIGASATINHKSHPRIPNYTLQNIPRDPGTTWAWEVGAGFAMSEGASTFAVDVALQPIWSTTWQEANAADVEASGGELGIGDRSIENDFFFTNAIIRSGMSHRIGIVGLQAGIEVRSYDYQLDQVNHVDSTFRDQHESWIEWSPTFGVAFAFAPLDLRYALRVTTGTGRPGTSIDIVRDASPSLSSSDFIVAPQGALTLQDARVVTHQLSVSIPVG